MNRMLCTVLLITACSTYETIRDADGRVYSCKLRDGTTTELCYFDDAGDELRDALDAVDCGGTGRWYPWLTNALGKGCVYSCEPHSGCNAKQGCYCP